MHYQTQTARKMLSARLVTFVFRTKAKTRETGGFASCRDPTGR